MSTTSRRPLLPRAVVVSLLVEQDAAALGNDDPHFPFRRLKYST